MLTVKFPMGRDWIEREMAIERVLGCVSDSGGSNGVTRTLYFDIGRKRWIEDALQRACPGCIVSWGKRTEARPS